MALWCAYAYAELTIQYVSYYARTLRSCVYMKNTFAKMDTRQTVYFTGVAFLDVACRMSTNGFSDELVDILTVLLGLNVHIPRYSYQLVSSVFFSEYSS